MDVTTTAETKPSAAVVESISTEEEIMKDNPPETIKTYAQMAKEKGMRYTVSDVPPLSTSIFLGAQHLLTMLGATVLIPLIIAPAMGANLARTSEMISTIFFVSGINTLIQTTFGDRLPIVQGGSFSFLPATFSIIFNPSLQAIEDDDERFLETMRVLQGSIIIVGIIQIVIGYTGAVVPVLRFISPVIIAPVIAAIGLGLYNVGFSNVANCFPMGLLQIGLTILFSQYLKHIKINGFSIFSLFPIILAIALNWSFFAILTAGDVYDEGSMCRTDSNRDAISDSPWFRVPYPGQWGAPVFKSYAIVPMIGSMLASMIESIGDYYSCARLAGAPPPTPGIISRGLASEGIGVVVAGLFGTGNGTTSYSENIGALSLTGVGSRAVVQCAGVCMIIVSIFAKATASLASMPSAMVGGIYCCLFGLIVAVGLSNLQFIDLNSERNLFILGFSIFNSLSIAGPAGYFSTVDENPFGNTNAGEVALAIFSSPMIIALLSSFFLDNTIPGTREERGLHIWDKVRGADIHNDPEYVETYSLPIFFAKLFHNCGYLEYSSQGSFPDPPEDGYQPGRGGIGDLCCPFIVNRFYQIPSETVHVQEGKDEGMEDEVESIDC